ncbi:response regulator [Fodinicurvata fenggangensis]|uniref:response regulator n=1 Tax=Fodinicurvata fenggangensis TaxID=1121830 RepID=UPI001B8091EC|nr:response regulator [Fodinicurvata fenggangensis]
MSSMLNTLLDINQIDTGTIIPEMADIPLDTLLARMREEFAYQAEAQGLDLRVVTCGLTVHSDPNLLSQMLRNLLSNALKYTQKGKVLLGCRQRADSVTIEIWDTGAGIPDSELQAIFDEYHQVGNEARERSRGLGLGLSIVKRLADLLDHRLNVRSHVGKGSAFTIEVARPQGGRELPRAPESTDNDPIASQDSHRQGSILVVEDDPDVRELLDLLLTGQGHTVVSAEDGPAALQAVTDKAFQPDLLIADFNLPNGMNGLEVATALQKHLRDPISVAFLTGDKSVASISRIQDYDCDWLNKPVNAGALSAAVQRLLAAPRAVLSGQDMPAADFPDNRSAQPTIYVVDDSNELRETLRDMLVSAGFVVQEFESGEAFLETWPADSESCLLLDAKLPGMSGLELLSQLREAGYLLPVVVLTGFGDVAMAVDAMKRGATDFIEKPVSHNDLLKHIREAIELSGDETGRAVRQDEAKARIDGLTPRQQQILMMILDGHPNKNIAADLEISRRTVESHRASIMKKTGCQSLPALARLAVVAGLDPGS